MGSNENVSAIISIKSEAGSSSSAVQREAFNKLINNTQVYYQGKNYTIDRNNYSDFAIKQSIKGRGSGKGNHTWSGFLYVSIRGGQQDKIETHAGQQLTLFNPACEYASSDVCEDINLVMSYYALLSIDENDIRAKSEEKWREYNFLIKNLEKALKNIYYNFETYKGNLYDCVKRQYSVSLIPGQLTDPIQLSKITIDKFNIRTRTEDSIDCKFRLSGTQIPI